MWKIILGGTIIFFVLFYFWYSDAKEQERIIKAGKKLQDTMDHMWDKE